MSSEPFQIEYGTVRPPRWRRVVRLLLALVVLAGATWTAVQFGWPIVRAVQIYRLQGLAVAHLAPSSQAVVTRTETSLGGGGSGATRPTLARAFHGQFDTPEPWMNFLTAAGLNRGPAVFVGRRRSPGGNERIVYAYVAGNWQSFGRATTVDELKVVVGFRILVAGTLLRQPMVVGPASQLSSVVVPGRTPLRVYAAVPHPSDPSAFSFRIETDGATETVDAYLRDDDTVLVVPRNPTIVDGPVREL